MLAVLKVSRWSTAAAALEEKPQTNKYSRGRSNSKGREHEQGWLAAIIFNRPWSGCVLFFYLGYPSLRQEVLYCRGWPTSLVLLLRVEVAELSFPLSCHPSLNLHDLLCLVVAARGLVALGGVEVVEILPLRAATGFVEVVHGVGAVTAAVGGSGICSERRQGRFVSGGFHDVCRSTPPVHQGAGRDGHPGLLWQLTTTAHSIALAGLLQVFIGAIDLCRDKYVSMRSSPAANGMVLRISAHHPHAVSAVRNGSAFAQIGLFREQMGQGNVPSN